ncbi:MAG: D-TA family PLP-dependent enzyme [Desulfobacterales bacterium]|nr:D-TA family PLP-dependent enzyme [Desulfobacterales bacterium]
MEEYKISNAQEIPTPALVVYKSLVEENIRTMGNILGGFGRLRPHVKTHKMSGIVKMQMDAGITKFKCATPKEAEMLVMAGAKDILISYQLFGPAIDRVVGIKKKHPDVTLRVIADNGGVLRALSDACIREKVTIGVMVDLNTGMGRTGCTDEDEAVFIASRVDELPGLILDGVHAYDGHANDPDPRVRRQAALESIQKAKKIRDLIEEEEMPVKTLVASGSPSFDFSASMKEVDEVSPGTWIFWDFKYSDIMPGRFRWAALVLSRLISKPAPDLICLDAGSKAIAPDAPSPQFRILDPPENLEPVLRSEEHQVLRLPRNPSLRSMGELFYLIPWHICTTVNLYDEAHVIDKNGKFVETWPIEGRGH